MRNQESNPSLPLLLRDVTLVVAVTLLAAGGGLFFLPEAARLAWPWVIDAFHACLYGMVFTTIAVGGVGLSHFAAPVERLTLGLAYAVLGLFSLFSVIVADANRQAVDWAASGVWLWVALFALLFALGLALMWWSSSQREAGQ